MELIFRIQKTNKKDAVPVEVVLKDKNRVIGQETVRNAEKVLEGLDKILKKSKIRITALKNIESIKIDDLNKSRYTSYRIIKSIEKALKLKIF